MKKLLIATAVAAAAASVGAAEVNLYGAIDTGLTYTHANGVDSVEMTSGNYAGPRFGLRGTEQLGDNLKVGFILEAGFASDTGKMAKDDTLFNRESQVYLTGDWGTVGFGRIGAFTSGSSSMSWYWDLEPFETGYYDAGTQATMLNVWSLHSNSMYYVSPTFAGAKFGIQYSMTGDADKEAELWEERDQWVNAAVRWDAETVHALAGVEYYTYGDKANANGPELKDTINAKLAVAWDALPDVRLYAGAAAFKNARSASSMVGVNADDFDTANSGKGLDGYAFNLGARYRVGATDFLAQVQYLDGENKAAFANAKTDEFSRTVGSLGLHYHFSPRTMGYVIGSYANGDDMIADDVTYAHVGLTHFF